MFKRASKPKYRNPAVKEAIFEAKFNYDSFDSAMPGQIFELVKSKYPHKQDVKHELIFLEKDVSSQPSGMPKIQAPLMRVRSSDNSELLQFGPGIIVANRLKYTEWEDFLPAITQITNSYLDVASPKITNRVGIRYINSFLISEPNLNIFDYFKINIDIPQALSTLNGFNLVFENVVDSFCIRTRFLTDVLAPNEVGNKFILDIDCYTASDFKPTTKEIINLAERAHEIVGGIFEEIITDKSRVLMGSK